MESLYQFFRSVGTIQYYSITDRIIIDRDTIDSISLTETPETLQKSAHKISKESDQLDLDSILNIIYCNTLLKKYEEFENHYFIESIEDASYRL